MGWNNLMTRGATLLHSCEVFDVGGAFAMSSFGSRAMWGVFRVLASFLMLAIGLPHLPELLTLALGWLSPRRVRVGSWKQWICHVIVVLLMLAMVKPYFSMEVLAYCYPHSAPKSLGGAMQWVS